MHRQLNADKLISGLGGEAKNWEEHATLGKALENAVGDVLVCRRRYLPGLVAAYRLQLRRTANAMKDAKMAHTENCTL